MFIEFIDSLRCVHGHPPSSLVAVIEASRERQVLQGTLGCPGCGSRYDIRNGVADFRISSEAAGGAARAGDEPEPAPDGSAGGTNSSVQEDDVLRFRALLDLAEPRGTVAIIGDADHLTASPGDSGTIHFLVINGGSRHHGHSDIRVSRLLVDRGALPLAAGCLRAAHLGEDATPDRETLASLIDAVAPGGRIVAPVGLAVPRGVRILASDDRQWVAQKEDVPRGLVQISR